MANRRRGKAQGYFGQLGVACGERAPGVFQRSTSTYSQTARLSSNGLQLGHRTHIDNGPESTVLLVDPQTHIGRTRKNARVRSCLQRLGQRIDCAWCSKRLSNLV